MTIITIQICPLLVKHYVYPMTNSKVPTLTVQLLYKNVSLLLDTGAHVSVLPRSLLPEVADLISQGHTGRLVKAFGGQQIQLDGPVCINVSICGLNILHPFYFVDLETPAIGGYDLMRAAHLVIDAHSAEVWSCHPDVAHSVPWPSGDKRTVQPFPLSNGMNPLVLGHKTQPLCIADDTSVEADHPIVTGNDTLTSCATEGTFSRIPLDTSQVGTETTAKALDPRAVPFQPNGTPFAIGLLDSETDVTDELPDHINLLYESTVSKTRMTHDVDKQFKAMLLKHKDTFATSSTDLGFCDVLQHDIDTADSPCHDLRPP